MQFLGAVLISSHISLKYSHIFQMYFVPHCRKEQPSFVPADYHIFNFLKPRFLILTNTIQYTYIPLGRRMLHLGSTGYLNLGFQQHSLPQYVSHLCLLSLPDDYDYDYHGKLILFKINNVNILIDYAIRDIHLPQQCKYIYALFLLCISFSMH